MEKFYKTDLSHFVNFRLKPVNIIPLPIRDDVKKKTRHYLSRLRNESTMEPS